DCRGYPLSCERTRSRKSGHQGESEPRKRTKLRSKSDRRKRMKAIVYTQYGSPDVLQFKEVEKPAPREGQILIKIYAASANPLDWHLMRASPFLARLAGGLRKPKDPRLGADFAGRVEAVGPNVTQFQPGDEVF